MGRIFINRRFKRLPNILFITLSIRFLFMLIQSYSELPRYERTKNIIENVEKYAKMIPLSYMEKNAQFRNFTRLLATYEKPPYIIYFDLSNYDMTLNHICNLRRFPDAHRRLVLIALEQAAEKKLRLDEPSVPVVTVDFTLVKRVLPKVLENRAYIVYQLILLLRARVSEALARRNIDFWTMQQDSLWTSDLGWLSIEQEYAKYNMLFDTVGNDQVPVYFSMSGWICGATFFTKGGALSAQFYRKVAYMMTKKASPDSSIMTYLCGSKYYNCAKLPKSIVSSSDYFLEKRDVIPTIIQVDRSQNMSKMELFRRDNLEFYKGKGSGCDMHTVDRLNHTVVNALQELNGSMKTIKFGFVAYYFHVFKQLIGLDPYNNKQFLSVHFRTF